MRTFTPLSATIASGAARSTEIATNGRVRGISFKSPGTMPETVNLEVSLDGGATYGPLSISGSDLAFTAGKVQYLDYAGFSHFRFFSSSGNVGGDRAFQVGFVEEI